MEYGNLRDKRKIAVLSPGPIHLFWTTGILYLLELGKNYDVVIVSDELGFLDDSRITILRQLSFVLEIVGFSLKSRLKSHINTASKIKELFSGYAPDVIYTHNVNYPFDVYLVDAIRKVSPAVEISYYQTGRMYLSRVSEFRSRLARDSAVMNTKFGINSAVASSIVSLRNSVASFLNYIAFPLLVRGSIIRPVVDVFTGTNKISNARRWHDLGLSAIAYTTTDADVLKGEGFQDVVITDHPAKAHLEQFLDILGEKSEVNSRIIVFPSWGFAPLMLQKMSRETVIKIISDGWLRALTELTNRFPSHTLAIKLHPSAREDSIWGPTMTILLERFPALAVIDPKMNAEILICSSDVIVGDVSSTLWWASLIGGKTVISVDYFGYSGGNEMSNYSGIEMLEA